jgi:hypothetical protein
MVTSKAEEYRAKARECEENAEKTRDSVMKQRLIELAQQWRTLRYPGRSMGPPLLHRMSDGHRVVADLIPSTEVQNPVGSPARRGSLVADSRLLSHHLGRYVVAYYACWLHRTHLPSARRVVRNWVHEKRRYVSRGARARLAQDEEPRGAGGEARIIEDGSASTPPDRRWGWSIVVPVRPESGIVTSGRASTQSEAKADFKRNWTAVRAAALPSP